MDQPLHKVACFGQAFLFCYYVPEARYSVTKSFNFWPDEPLYHSSAEQHRID
jgi:hypothetical protein